jgi:hypothetical protein
LSAFSRAARNDAISQQNPQEMPTCAETNFWAQTSLVTDRTLLLRPAQNTLPALERGRPTSDLPHGIVCDAEKDARAI